MNEDIGLLDLILFPIMLTYVDVHLYHEGKGDSPLLKMYDESIVNISSQEKEMMCSQPEIVDLLACMYF